MNKVTSTIKRYKKTSIVMFLCLIFYIGYAMPFKATDPRSSVFSEQLFRLRDYGSTKGVRELTNVVLPNLFPVGTSKKYVDLMLVERGNASIIDKTHFAVGMYTYSYTPLYLRLTPDAFNIKVFYDKDQNVQGIHFGGKMIVGKNYQPELAKEKKQ